MAYSMSDLLQLVVSENAADLHLRVGTAPVLRVHGVLHRVEGPGLRPEDTEELMRSITSEEQIRSVRERGGADFGFAFGELARFRVSVFKEKGNFGMVLRQIPTKLLTLEQIGIPPSVRELLYKPRGLVLVTGPTGSGKTTTLASMINIINEERDDAHLITIEDPIEYYHKHKKAVVTQREVNVDVPSFAEAIRRALRQDPDVILVGEMRDLETIEIAIETAETGHLVFATVHTNNAASTVDRIIDKFPTDRQNQIRTMLAETLKGVVAQTLCKKTTKGRAAAVEVLVVTNAVSSNIRDGKTHMIPSAMQIGKNVGMQLFNDAFINLVKDGVVSPKEAYMKAIDKDGLVKKFLDLGIPFDVASLNDDAGGAASGGASPEKLKQRETMIASLTESLKRTPDSLDALNNLAWLLSTSIYDKLRNGAEAVRLAERAYALTKGRNPAILDTLSATYAEAGKFDKALESAKRGLELAKAMNEVQLAEHLKVRIGLYEKGQPIREE